MDLTKIKDKNMRIFLLCLFILFFGVAAFSNKFQKKTMINSFFQSLTFFLILIGMLSIVYKIKKEKILFFLKKFNNFSVETYQIFIFYLIISFLSLWKLFVSPGVVGLRDDWSIPPYHNQLLIWSFDEKNAWSSLGFGFPYVYPSEYILRFSIGLLSIAFNLNGEIVSKFFLLVIIYLSGIFAYSLGKFLKFNNNQSFITGLFYMLTPVLFNRIIPGYLTYLLSYALLPLIFGLFIKYRSEKFNLKHLITLSLLNALGFTHLNFIVLIPTLLLIYSLINFYPDKIAKDICYIVGSTIIPLLLHFNWILPLLVDVNKVGEMISMKSHTWVESFNPPLTNVFLLQGATYGFFAEVLQRDISLLLIWIFSVLLLLLLIGLPIVIHPKNKNIFSITVIILLFAFICKGSNPPLGFIFKFFYNNISLLVIFRDLHNLLVVLCLGYSILLGYSFDIVKKTFKNNLLCLIIFIVMLLLYSFPFFTGNFGGYLQTYNIDIEYQKLYNYFKNMPGDFRILWLPFIPPISYTEDGRGGLDPLISYSPKQTTPSLISSNTPPEIYTLVLDNLFHYNITNNIKSLLDFANIKYIIYRRDAVSKLRNFHFISNYPEIDKNYNNDRILLILKNQKGIYSTDNKIYSLLKPKYPYERFIVYNTSSNSHKIKLCNNPYLVSGSYKEFIYLVNENLINNYDCVFFTNQINKANKLKNINTIIKDDYLEFITSFIPNKYKIDLNDFVYKSNAENGWVKLFVWWWYDWNYLSGLQYGVFTKKADIIRFKITLENSSVYAILLKPFFSINASKIYVFIDDVKVAAVNTKSIYKKDFLWVYLTDYYLTKGVHEIEIRSDDGENAIERMIIIPRDKLNKFFIESKKFLENVNYRLVFTLKNNIKSNKLNNESLVSNDSYFYVSNITIYSFLDENYSLKIKANGLVVFNNQTITVNNTFINLGTFHLSEGQNNIPIKGSVKSLIFEKGNFKEKYGYLNYTKISNSHYKINLSHSGIISFSESYDPSWSINNGEHFLCNGFANCFLVNNTQLDLIYKKQYFYNFGFYVGGFTLFCCLLILLYQNKK